jgi:arginine deiminase
MSEKVVLTKKVADALEFARKRGDEEVIEIIFDSGNSYIAEDVEILNEFDRMTLVHALMNGYEVEETPADQVREYYKEIEREQVGACDSEFGVLCAEKVGICRTLNLLGLKIEGVNYR